MAVPETLAERQIAKILENTEFASEVDKSSGQSESLNQPSTYRDKLHSDLEYDLVIVGGLVGVVGGGIAANMMVNTEGLAWFLAISTRVAVVTPLGITVGTFVGTGYGWLAAKAINSIRSRFS